MTENVMKQFSGRRYINLESYEADGKPHLSLVQSEELDGVLYLRTDPTSTKIGRIRVNQHVRAIPCDRKGNPMGPWAEGEAQILEAEESPRVSKLLKTRYGLTGGFLVGLMARLKGQHLTTVIAIRLKEPAPANTA